MIGADTNILVRFLVRDVEDQARKVMKLFEDGEKIFINQVVIVELYWMLINVYDYPKMIF